MSSAQFRGWSASGPMRTQDDELTQSLQASFDTPGIHTVQFSLIRPDAVEVPAYGIPRPLALIEWSVSGATLTRLISVSDGVSISGNAEGVRVTVRDNSFVPEELVPLDYKVAMTVVPGVRPGTSKPIREIRPTDIVLTDGESNLENSCVRLKQNQFVIYRVPMGTGVDSALFSAGPEEGGGAFSPDEGVTVDLLGTNVLNPWISYLGLVSNLNGFQPLSSSVSYIRMRCTPNNNANAARVNVIFGIEG